ncbi:hypothetical protein [Pseudomonas capsici]|uniref:hypothetical protein n=1 Tax=Pseudomonas capsici TaxID=2810614 RepID=UPI00403AB495
MQTAITRHINTGFKKKQAPQLHTEQALVAMEEPNSLKQLKRCVVTLLNYGKMPSLGR